MAIDDKQGARPNLTPAQLDAGADYLASCAGRDGVISGLYSWLRLAEITGEDPRSSGAGLVLFAELRAAGRLVDLPSVPGTFGHSLFRIVPAPVDPVRPALADAQRQRLALQAASPKRAEPGAMIAAQHDCSALPLFGAAAQPSLF